jgi:hypothetical protein
MLLGVAVTPAHAFDLTGHWTGKWSCKGFDSTKFTSGNKGSTMDVTQVAGTFAIAIDAATDNFTYNAVAIPDLNKPNEKGEVALLGCHVGTTLPAPPLDGELVRASVKTKANGKATFTGTSVFADNFPEVGTCKYSYKRVPGSADPGLAACP